MTPTRLFSLVAVLAIALAGDRSAFAQADTVTRTYEINGLKVIHHQRSTSEIVAVNLYLLGGVRQLTPESAGTESFLMAASRYGTRSYPGEASRRALARTGSVIIRDADRDWSRLSFYGLAAEFDSTWAIFADRVMHPTLDSATIALVKARFLSDISARNQSPDAQSAALASDLAYRGHAYALHPDGAEQSISALTADRLRQYQSTQMITSRMLLVIVGNVQRSQVEQAVTRTLGTLPRGSYVWSLPPALKPSKPDVAMAQRNLPTNYIRGFFAGPQRSSPDFPAFDFAMQVLGSLIASRVRGTGAFSYSAGASLVNQGAAGGQIYVSTTRPDTVMKLINDAIDDLAKNVAFPRFVLTEAANSYTSAYTRMIESSGDYADLLARAQLYGGDYRSAAQYRDLLRKVVPTDLKKAVETYAKNIQWGFVGDTTKAPRDLMVKR